MALSNSFGMLFSHTLFMCRRAFVYIGSYVHRALYFSHRFWLLWEARECRRLGVPKVYSQVCGPRETGLRHGQDLCMQFVREVASAA